MLLRPPLRRLLPLLPLLLQCKAPPPPPAEASRSALRTPAPSRADERAEAPAPAVMKAPEVRPLRRCFAEDTALSQPRPVNLLLDHAAELYDQATDALRDHALPGLPPHARELLEGSLACAEEAARADPRSVDAHYSRAIAFVELGRLEAARDAFSRALALDPDDVKTLAGAADLYVNHLAPGPDHTETGLEYARRGTRRVRRVRDRPLAARLALLEGQALNDLGHAREALARLDASIAAEDSVQARYERAVALFDLCRFEEARRAFQDVVARAPRDAWAHHHLGLVLEFLGRPDDASREFALARKERPQDFREPLPLSPAEFREIAEREARALPGELQADLAQVALETAELPDVADLTAEEPPLSPTILGLFRGPPLGVGGPDSPRTIVLYRRNLLRAVATREDLVTQVRTTLLHELGHLRGEDDEVLRARGLE